jgi:hypothetical protein
MFGLNVLAGQGMHASVALEAPWVGLYVPEGHANARP